MPKSTIKRSMEIIKCNKEKLKIRPLLMKSTDEEECFKILNQLKHTNVYDFDDIEIFLSFFKQSIL